METNKTVYLDEYDIIVNKYLTYAQIQQITNAVIQFDMWAERQQNIDMLILYHATNIGKDKLESMNHNELITSGLIDNVCKNIENIDKIYDAIEYTESIQRALTQVLKKFPDIITAAESKKKNGSSTK